MIANSIQRDEEILWTYQKLQGLKEAYQIAHLAERQYFEFEGHPFVTQYAKYLIEYLETALIPTM